MDSIYEFLAKIPPIIPQIIGITGTVLYILCFQLKHRIGIILMNATSRLLFVIQYCLLGAFAGAILDILGITAAFVATKKDKEFFKKHALLIFTLTVAVILAGGIFSIVLAFKAMETVTPWAIILSILPTVGVLLHSSAFFLTEERKIRLLSLAGSPFWFVYNTASKAYGSSVGDVLSMASIISAMIRYKKQEKAKKRHNKSLFH
jgi:glucan phosphoethanolaminetransferase (alkaline phosphatase superfamily)